VKPDSRMLLEELADRLSFVRGEIASAIHGNTMQQILPGVHCGSILESDNSRW